jgi:predicted transcriptional regulator of viral defense system
MYISRVRYQDHVGCQCLPYYLSCAIIGLGGRIDDMKGNQPKQRTTALGPASADLLLSLSDKGKSIFSVTDARAITKQSYERTADLLRKLARKRWLVRLVPGKYLIVPLEAGLEGIPMADRYVIAREVLSSVPYYVSHYSAMEIHQMTTQPVTTVYVTVAQRRRSRTIVGMHHRFVYASERSFWGWQQIWATPEEQVQVSDLEKTLLDCAARPELCGGLGELSKGLWLRKDDVNDGRLVEYIERLNHKAAAKRIGFLLETHEMGDAVTISFLKSFISRGYDLLDPTLPDEGPYRKRWRLRVNLDPEELKATVWT